MKEIDFRYDLLPLKDKLFRLALRITLDKAEAEDVTQETLLRAWDRKKELAEVESIEAYLLTICRNFALDRIRKKETQNLPLDAQAMDTADNAPSPAEKMEHEEKLRRVHQLFNRLPEKQRAVMQLRDIEGKSYREIAAILDVTEAQVKVTLFRARQAVRTQYEKIENYGL